MTDLEKIQRMKDMNWTPAVTYWHDKYQITNTRNAFLESEVERLQALVDSLKESQCSCPT